MEGTSTNADPFDIEQKPVNFQPVLSAALLDELRAKMQQVPPEQAAALIEQVAKATQEKKSANEILNTVFSVIGKGAGLFL